MELTNDLKILLVDDSQMLANINGLLLKRALPGAEVIVADDMNALDIMAANPDITLVISDFNMPSMTGQEFFKQIRESGNSVPFVLSTGGNNDRQEEIEAFFECNGGNAVFTEKPLTVAKLQTALTGLQPKPQAPDNMPTP